VKGASDGIAQATVWTALSGVRTPKGGSRPGGAVISGNGGNDQRSGATLRALGAGSWPARPSFGAARVAGHGLRPFFLGPVSVALCKRMKQISYGK